MIKITQYPKSAKDVGLKIKHLIGEATANKEGVVGVIAGIDVTVWPEDDANLIMKWLELYHVSISSRTIC